MPDTVQFVQARRRRLCQITASGNLAGLCETAINAQVAGLGTKIRKSTIGFRILTASGSFTISNADGTGTATIPTTMTYDCPAIQGIEQSLLAGGATLLVEVFYDQEA